MEAHKSVLSVFLALLLLTAGCMSGGPAESTTQTETPAGTPTPTATPTATELSETPTETPTPPDSESALNEPDPDKEVRIENEWNQTVEITIRIIREQNNETVHHETYELAPDGQETVYNLSEAEPDGIEAFTVVVTAQNETQRVSIETNACYGNTYAVIMDDGSLNLFYAIC